jgi:hypothetical protein
VGIVLLLWILRVFHHPTERTRTKAGVAKMSRAKLWGGATWPVLSQIPGLRLGETLGRIISTAQR